MAFAGNTTYNQAGNRESLMDIVTMISPKDTPMFSSFQRGVKVTNTTHTWTTDALANAAENKAVEGADFSYAARTAKASEYNYTQIFTKTWEVSGTQEVVAKTGVQSEWTRNAENAMYEMSNDVERAIVLGARSAGASGTAREMGGVLEFIATNVEVGSGSGTESLTRTMIDNALQLAWAQGGKPDTIFANAFQKRAISSLMQSVNTVNADANAKKIVGAVDVYESDFGLVNVVLDRYMTTSVIALLETKRWAIGELRPIAEQSNIAVTGDGMKGAIVGELTLISYNEKASAKVTQLATS
jgi:hypothetical protein